MMCISMGFLFFTPSPTHAAGCYTSRSTILPGKRFAKIIVTNSSNSQDGKPSNGTTCYIQVDQNIHAVDFTALKEANIVEDSWKDSSSVEQTWSSSDDAFQPDVESSNPAVIIIVNAQSRPLKNQVFSLIDNPNAAPIRLAISLNRGFTYIYFGGFESAQQDEITATKDCKLQFFRDHPECYREKFDAKNDPSDLYNSIAGDVSIPSSCKDFYYSCIEKARDASLGPSVSDMRKNDPRYNPPDGYQGPLPSCAFSYDGCRNLSDVIEFLIKIGKILFTAIGSVAFVMFIYGGLTMILSMGNAEKVKKGQEILVAAVVGIIIAFGAYLLIDFVLNTLQVGQDFRAIGTSTSETK